MKTEGALGNFVSNEVDLGAPYALKLRNEIHTDESGTPGGGVPRKSDDFDSGASSFSRKENVIRDYPKGKKWHTRTIPPELLAKLRVAKSNALGEFVAPSPNQPMLSYDGYYDALKRYCKEAELPLIGTHGLRHSASGFYMANGATRDDLRKLFAHSSSLVTDLYCHDKGERVDQLAKVIRLFPEGAENLTDLPCSTNVPRSLKTEVERKEEVC